MNEVLWRYLRIDKKTIEGWLQRVDAEIIGSILQFQFKNKIAGSCVEIGLHHGKSFIPLCLALEKNEMALGIDIFDDQKKNLDASGKGDLKRLLENMGKFQIDPKKVQIFRGSSETVNAKYIHQTTGPVRFFSIDGGHSKAVVLNDLRLAEQTLATGGVIALDDYCRADWPDVTAGYVIWRESTCTDIIPFAIGSNKLFLCQKDFSEVYRSALKTPFLNHFFSKNYKSDDAEIDSYRTEPFDQDEAKMESAQLYSLKIFQPDAYIKYKFETNSNSDTPSHGPPTKTQTTPIEPLPRSILNTPQQTDDHNRGSGLSVHEKNLISCLMVTRGNPQMVAQAIHSFLRQTHEKKELIIVSDANNSTALRQLISITRTDQIRLIEVKRNGLPLGDLRNISVEHAQGEYICQWDDDDIYHPNRLSLQLKALILHNSVATALSRWTIWWPHTKQLAISNHRLWEGSLLCQKSVMPRYPSIRKGEDTELIEALKKKGKIILIDAPFLYLYVVHGNNTFEANHFAEMYRCATETFAGPDYDRKLESMATHMAIDCYPTPIS